jgi:hypothetical protein
MKLVILFTSPPPLHKVRLDEAGLRQDKKGHIQQWRWNEDLMHDCKWSCQYLIPTPVTTDKVAHDDPILLPISDDDSVDSSLYSRDSESEGGIWDNQHNDDVSIAPEGAQANSIR